MLEGTLQTPAESIVYSHPFTKKDTINFSWLMNAAPCFPVAANSIKIITEPKQFYDTIFDYCRTATKRITLVSLYLGTGDLENNLVNALMKNEHFIENKLKINVLLDYTRGSRDEYNSRVALQPLLQQNDINCTVSLYHTPILRGLLKKYMPNRWNELVGLQHMKLYIFDDTLIISGANLSKDYFTNRQDRYFLIRDKNLCDFYSGLIQKVQNFSLRMDKHNGISCSNDWNCLPYEGNKEEFIERAGDMVEQYLINYNEEQNMHRMEGFDTWIFPTFQMGQLGIEQDSYITDRLLAEAPEGAKLKIATGYFNLTSQYMNTLIQNTSAECEIIMAHPKANGFLGAKGPAGGIPYAYSLIAHEFRKQYESNGQSYRIKLLEYLRNGWTYHAKGLWYYSPNSNYPCMTIIGSPNFGERSVTKDLETQLVIVTENETLQKEMHQECQGLYKMGLPAETERKVPFWVYTFVALFRSYF